MPALPTPTESGYADVNGVKIWYQTYGEGDPLILLHGGFGTIEMFGPNIELLAAHRKVIGVDLQGHGGTGPLGRPMTFENMATDIAELIKVARLREGRRVWLLARRRHRDASRHRSSRGRRPSRPPLGRLLLRQLAHVQFRGHARDPRRSRGHRREPRSDRRCIRPTPRRPRAVRTAGSMQSRKSALSSASTTTSRPKSRTSRRRRWSWSATGMPCASAPRQSSSRCSAAARRTPTGIARAWARTTSRSSPTPRTTRPTRCRS